MESSLVPSQLSQVKPTSSPEQPLYLPPGPESELVSKSISHYAWVLWRNRWRLLSLVGFCGVLTLFVSLRMQPVYEATAIVDIDRQGRAGVVGQEALQPGVQDAEQFIATQIALIRSDAVLRPVAERYDLLAHEGQVRSMRARSGVRPQEAPIQLKNLRVTHPPNTYLIRISYRSTDPYLAAAVANEIAQSYLRHVYEIRLRSSQRMTEFMEQQLEQLKAKMERSSRALSEFERELNVINPEEKTTILSARLLELNKQYTEAQAERIRKQSALEALRSGDVDAVALAGYGEDLRALRRRLNEARQELAELRTHLGPNHPQYRKVAAQIEELESQIQAMRTQLARQIELEFRQALTREEMLAQAVTETKQEFDRLNARSFEYQTLKREAESDKALYEELIRKIREAGINASFQNSSIRIADVARPPVEPVAPNIPLNVGLALVLATLFGCGAAIFADMLDSTVRDSEQARRILGVEVLGTLPKVKGWRARPLLGGENVPRALLPAPAQTQQAHSFQEAIRTLRNTILLGDLDRRIRSLLITSATPGEGKSTIALHLALAHANQGYRTLLVDGDLRRPTLHRRLNLPGLEGLSTLVGGSRTWKTLIQAVPDVPTLSFLAAGAPSPQVADLVGFSLAELLEQASTEYDLIIVDAPPIGGFAETLQMAALADGVILVTRAGETQRQLVRQAIAMLQRVRATLLGLVLNEVNEQTSEYHYYYRHYTQYAGDELDA